MLGRKELGAAVYINPGDVVRQQNFFLAPQHAKSNLKRRRRRRWKITLISSKHTTQISEKISVVLVCELFCSPTKWSCKFVVVIRRSANWRSPTACCVLYGRAERERKHNAQWYQSWESARWELPPEASCRPASETARPASRPARRPQASAVRACVNKAILAKICSTSHIHHGLFIYAT